MDRCPLTFGYQRIGRLLDPVVKEGVGALELQDQSRPNCLPEGGLNLFFRLSAYQAQGCQLGNVPQAGHLSQGFLRVVR